VLPVFGEYGSPQRGTEYDIPEPNYDDVIPDIRPETLPVRDGYLVKKGELV
jgi:hypothetical protein